MVINMKIVKKIITIVLLLFIVLAFINTVYANNDKDGAGGGTATRWADQSSEWWKPQPGEIEENKIIDKANVITTVIRNIGIVCAVIALMVIGIKEMTSSVEEKSIIKQALPVYILGVIMVVAITTLPSIIYNIVKGLG